MATSTKINADAGSCQVQDMNNTQTGLVSENEESKAAAVFLLNFGLLPIAQAESLKKHYENSVKRRRRSARTKNITKKAINILQSVENKTDKSKHGKPKRRESAPAANAHTKNSRENTNTKVQKMPSKVEMAKADILPVPVVVIEKMQDVMKKDNLQLKPINEVKAVDHDTVPVEETLTKVPARHLKNIDWTSYSCATRKLMMAVFPRNVLATHSLTGRPPIAFKNKPVKKQLNPDLVQHIIQIVADKCGVSAKSVRTTITLKCADETKLLRKRQLKNKKTALKNIENMPLMTRG